MNFRNIENSSRPLSALSTVSTTSTIDRSVLEASPISKHTSPPKRRSLLFPNAIEEEPVLEYKDIVTSYSDGTYLRKLRQIHKLFKKRHYEEAITEYKKIQKEYYKNDDVYILYNIATCYHKSGQYEKAIQSFTLAKHAHKDGQQMTLEEKKATDGTWINIMYSLAKSYHDIENHKVAATHYNQLVDFFEKQHYEATYKPGFSFERVINTPDSKYILYMSKLNLARCHIVMHRYKEAFVLYEELLQQVVEEQSDPRLDWNRRHLLFFELGKLHMRCEQFQKAIQYFEKVLDENAQDVHVLYHKAKALISLGLITIAQDTLNECITKDPNHAPSYFSLALIALSLHDVNVAEQLLKKTVRIDPKNKDAFKLIGDIYTNMGSYRTAKVYYMRALDIDYSFEEALDNLNFVLLQLGESKVESIRKQPVLQSIPSVDVSQYFRVALGFANHEYKHLSSQFDQIRSPPLDMGSFFTNLFQLQFKTFSHVNQTLVGMKKAFHAFCKHILFIEQNNLNKNRPFLIVLYYNGYAFQDATQNYLLPADHHFREYPSKEAMLQHAIHLDSWLQELHDMPVTVKLCVIMDASRRHPLHQTILEEQELKRIKRIASQNDGVMPRKKKNTPVDNSTPIEVISLSSFGLAIPRIPPNTLYISSQAPDQFTNDQVTERSAFTKALHKFTLYPGIYFDTAQDVSADRHKMDTKDTIEFSSDDDEEEEEDLLDETFMTAVRDEVMHSPSKSNHREKFGACRLGAYISKYVSNATYQSQVPSYWSTLSSSIALSSHVQ